MDKEELVRLLLRLDEEFALCHPDGVGRQRPTVVIAGGSAFMLHDLTRRPVTHDVDVLAAESHVRALMSGYPAMNGRIAVYADHIPYNFEDRLVELDIGARALAFMTPSVEDLVVMKLYAQRPNDMQDIEGAIAQGRVDWALLERLVRDPDEARASALSPARYEEMASAFMRLKEEHGR